MGAFVKAVADIDDNGISLRYPQDKSGRLTQDRPLFVNNEEVRPYDWPPARLHEILQQELPSRFNLDAYIALYDFPFFLFCHDKQSTNRFVDTG